MAMSELPTAFELAGKPAPAILMMTLVASAGQAAELSNTMLPVVSFPLAGVTDMLPIVAAVAGVAAKILRPAVTTATSAATASLAAAEPDEMWAVAILRSHRNIRTNPFDD